MATCFAIFCNKVSRRRSASSAPSGGVCWLENLQSSSYLKVPRKSKARDQNFEGGGGGNSYLHMKKRFRGCCPGMNPGCEAPVQHKPQRHTHNRLSAHVHTSEAGEPGEKLLIGRTRKNSTHTDLASNLPAESPPCVQ